MPVEFLSYSCRFADVKSYGEDWTHIEAPTMEAAATTFASRTDQDGDYGIVRRGVADCPVEVKTPDGTITRWEITAEVVNYYYAKPEDAELA